MPENSKWYFYAGILAIVFFSMVTGFVYLNSEGPASNEYTAKITLTIQNETSGIEFFSTFIEEDTLFSGKQIILTFSPKDSEETTQITCTINCQWAGD